MLNNMADNKELGTMAWTIDPSHTRVVFSARHMMISNVHGAFENVTGVVEFDEQNPVNSALDVQIDASSINTHDTQRDGHLKSPDFLDVANFPKLTFKGAKMEVLSADRGRIIGDLTIREVTRPVTLDVDFNGVATRHGPVSVDYSVPTAVRVLDAGAVTTLPLISAELLALAGLAAARRRRG